MNKVNFFWLVVCVLALIFLVGCTTIDRSENVLDVIDPMFEITINEIPDEWDVVSIVEYPYAMDSSSKKGPEIVTIDFGKEAETNEVKLEEFNEKSKGNVKLAVSYDEIYAQLQIYKSPIEKWEHALTMVLNQDPKEYKKWVLNNTEIYFYTGDKGENHDVYIWMSNDKNYQYYFYPVKSMSLDKASETLEKLIVNRKE